MPSRNRKLLLVLLLALYVAAFAWQAWSVGITFDEPAHLMASYMYWRGEDILGPAVTPPVQHLLTGWAPLLLDTPLFRDSPAWEHNSMFQVAEMVLPKLEGPQTRRLIFLARLPMVMFPLGIAWLLWRWGSQIFDKRTGAGLAIASLLEPSLMAHAPLIKSDVAAAFGLLWISYACWRLWTEPCRRNLWHLALAVAIGAQTKFTMLPMIPLAMGAAALRYVSLRRWKLAIGAPLAVLAAAYVTLIAAYQFDYSRTTSHAFKDFFARESWRESEIEFMKRYVRVPVPKTFAGGVRFIWNHGLEGGQPAYMLGEAIETPEPLYFPLALAVKYPIPLQLLLLGGLGALAVRLWRRTAGAADFFIWAPALVVLGLTLPAKILVGFRYILPCVPLFILAGGFLFHEWRLSARKRAGRIPEMAAVLGMAWLLVASAWIYPNGISYFNEWAGGPGNGWKYLADSNIDWGQDIPRLAAYAREHELDEVRYAYFGKDVPEHYDFGSTRLESIPTPYCLTCVDTAVYTPEPGFYAISVNLLLGFYWSEEHQGYFRYFREREPVAKAGYSIFLYEVTSSFSGLD